MAAQGQHCDEMSETASTLCGPKGRRGRRSGSGSNDDASSVNFGARSMSHQSVPKRTDFVQKYGGQTSQKKNDNTTLMIRNIPNQCTRKIFLEELDNAGLKGLYDFVYVSMDRNTRWNVGYAFVNLISMEAVALCTKKFAGHRLSRFPQSKIITVSPAHMQGLKNNLSHYRDSAVQFSRLVGNRPLVIGSETTTESPDSSSTSLRERC